MQNEQVTTRDVQTVLACGLMEFYEHKHGIKFSRLEMLLLIEYFISQNSKNPDAPCGDTIKHFNQILSRAGLDLLILSGDRMPLSSEDYWLRLDGFERASPGRLR